MSDQGERVMRWTEMSDDAGGRDREVDGAEDTTAVTGAEEPPVRMSFPETEAKMPEVVGPPPAEAAAGAPHDVWGKVESSGDSGDAVAGAASEASLADSRLPDADDIKVAPVPSADDDLAGAPSSFAAEPGPAVPAPAEPGETDLPVAGSSVPAPDAASGPPAAGGQQAWEGSLFDGQGGDSGAGNDLYAPVTPTGPATPPKPGKPSSGNWQMPDWMDDEESADAMLGTGDDGGKRSRFGRSGRSERASAAGVTEAEPSQPSQPSGRSGPSAPADRASGVPAPPVPPRHDVIEDEGGRSRLVLIGGVGLLAVAVIAAGGVYFLKGRDSTGPAASEGKPGRPAAGNPGPQDEPKVQLPPDKVLKRFAGRPSRMLGRVPDAHSGLSYPRLAAPWQVPTKKNKLGVTGWSGQQILVTEKRAGQMWYGQLLTGTLVPTLRGAYKGPESVKPVAALAATGFEQSYYGFPHKTTPLASQPLAIGGRKGWLIASYLTYKRAGVRATGEVVVTAIIDTGRPSPGVVFASLPNTHRRLWPDLNQFVAQLKVVP
ncbi:hypothetical protein ACGFNU_24240 [Spirillospora sp. NPDC048911]|uniref:hypothetical protein n=1 Tax=Spirillospora sp. NPDC048911 TaxID=3364527 RepID=UPI003718CD91